MSQASRRAHLESERLRRIGRMPVRGVGLGLRHELSRALFDARPDDVKWLEIHPENYLGRGGHFASILDEARASYGIVTHGLTQCVGSPDPLDRPYLASLRAMLTTQGAAWHSEHLAWGNLGGRFTHDLLPLPFTRAAVRRAADVTRAISDALGLPVALENASYYGHPGDPEMDERAFLLEVLDASDACLLLDVNNVWVNAQNHGFDPHAFVRALPPERVVQVHVAGHFVRPDGLIIDTHAEPVCEGVYALLDTAIRHVGDVPILLERDGNYPELPRLLEELRRLDAIRERALASEAEPVASEVRP